MVGLVMEDFTGDSGGTDLVGMVYLAVMGFRDIVDLVIGDFAPGIFIASIFVMGIPCNFIMGIFPLAFSSDSALELYSHLWYTHTILIRIMFIPMILIHLLLGLHMVTLKFRQHREM